MFGLAICPQVLSLTDGPAIIRARPVTVDVDVLLERASDKPAVSSQSVRPDLFDDVSCLAVRDRAAEDRVAVRTRGQWQTVGLGNQSDQQEITGRVVMFSKQGICSFIDNITC